MVDMDAKNQIIEEQRQVIEELRREIEELKLKTGPGDEGLVEFVEFVEATKQEQS